MFSKKSTDGSVTSTSISTISTEKIIKASNDESFNTIGKRSVPSFVPIAKTKPSTLPMVIKPPAPPTSLDNPTTSLDKTKKLLEQGERVFIWPEKYGKQLKDFNDICMKYNLDEITPDFVIANSFTHLQGMVLLSQIIKAHSSYAPLSGK